MTKILTIMLAAALLTACSESIPLVSPSPPTIRNIEVSAPTSSLPLGDSVEVRATATAADGSPFHLIAVAWTSSDVAVATVTATGPLTAEVRTISEGSVSIIATVESHSGHLALAVGPSGIGTIVISVSTSGTEVDTDGYNIVVTGDGGGISKNIGVPSNGTETIAGVFPGVYAVAVTGVAPTCMLAKLPAVVVSAAKRTDVSVLVTCSGEMADIVYTDYVEGNDEIFVTRSNSTLLRRLTVQPGIDGSATWSPDGNHIAFVSGRWPNSDIYIMDTDGSNVVQLTTEPGGNYQPDWSPDGKRIAFMSTRAGKGDIYLINADGSDEKLITLPYGAQTPSWSPDGKQLAVARGGPQSPADLPGLWLMNPDGTNLRQITHDLSGSPPFWSDITPAWSPDGTTIVFSRQMRNYRDLFVVKVDGSGLTQLTFDRGATHPAWSPDGDRIAFSAGTGYCDYDSPEINDCSSKILTMPAKGGAESVLTTGFDPSWSRR